MPLTIIDRNDKTDSVRDVPILDKEDNIYRQGINSDIISSTAKSVNREDQPLLGKDVSLEDSAIKSCPIILKSLTIELIMFIFMFSYMMRSFITSNLIIDKACRFRLNFSEEICTNLSNYKDEKATVEKIANDYNLYMELLQLGVAAVVMIFLGPWSDKYGRKPPLLLAIMGSLLGAVGSILNAYYFDARLEYMLLPSIPMGISGGFICFLTIMFSLVSEITTRKKRTVKYAFIEMALGLGMSLGSLTAGLIFKFANSYTVVYIVAASGQVMSGLWIIFGIMETKGLDRTESWKQKICDAFNFERLVEGFKVCIKERENRGRTQILLLFVSMCCGVLTMASFATIGYTYVHHRYDWDPATYSYVTTISTVVVIAIAVTCVPAFIMVFKVCDATLGILGTVSGMAQNICIGFASKPWIYYMGSGLGMLSGVGTLANRAMLSKLVPDDELGKVFSFMSTCEALVPLAGTLMITKIFNATIEDFPGLCYLVGAALLVLPLVIFIWLRKFKPSGYQITK